MTRNFGFPSNDDGDLPVIWMVDHWESLPPEPSRLGWVMDSLLVTSVMITIFGIVYFILR